MVCMTLYWNPLFLLVLIPDLLRWRWPGSLGGPASSRDMPLNSAGSVQAAWAEHSSPPGQARASSSYLPWATLTLRTQPGVMSHWCHAGLSRCVTQQTCVCSLAGRLWGLNHNKRLTLCAGDGRCVARVVTPWQLRSPAHNKSQTCSLFTPHKTLQCHALWHNDSITVGLSHHCLMRTHKWPALVIFC